MIHKLTENTCMSKLLLSGISVKREIVIVGEDFINDVNNEIKKLTGHDLYDCQKEVLKRLLEEYENRKSAKAVIQMATGLGKTRVSLAFLVALYKLGIFRYGDRGLFLAPRRVIEKQALEEFARLKMFTVKCALDVDKTVSEYFYNEFIEYEGNKPLLFLTTPQFINFYLRRCWTIEQGYGEFKGMDYYFYDIKRLETVLSKLKVIIFDEAHHTIPGEKISESIKWLLNNSGCAVAVGLTATPTQNCLELFNVSKPLYTKQSSEAMREKLLTSNLKIEVFETKVESPYISSKDDEWRVAIKERAYEYADKIVSILEREKNVIDDRLPKTLITATNIREAELLYECLCGQLGSNVVWIAHSDKDREAQKNINDFKKASEGILVAVDMVNLGFDHPDLEVLAIARPMKSPVAYTQLRGRLIRKSNNHRNLKNRKYALILDLANTAVNHEKEIDRVEAGEFDARGYNMGLGGYGKGTQVISAKVGVNPTSLIYIQPNIMLSINFTPTFKCKYCPKMFKNLDSCIQHMFQKHHNNYIKEYKRGREPKPQVNFIVQANMNREHTVTCASFSIGRKTIAKRKINSILNQIFTTLLCEARNKSNISISDIRNIPNIREDIREMISKIIFNYYNYQFSTN